MMHMTDHKFMGLCDENTDSKLM